MKPNPPMPEIDPPRLVTPEPDNPAEEEALSEIERSYCRLDDGHFRFCFAWTAWAAGNDISKEDLFGELDMIAEAAAQLREDIATLEERRVEI